MVLYQAILVNEVREQEMKEAAKSREELESEGWTAGTVTGGDHLKRIMEMYQETGIETYLEEVKPEECGECTECYTAGNETMYRIYTKPIDD